MVRWTAAKRRPPLRYSGVRISVVDQISMPNLAGPERPPTVPEPGAATFDSEHVGIVQQIAHSPFSPMRFREEPAGTHLFGRGLLPYDLTLEAELVTIPWRAA